jgi:phospholipid-binding lipoprotein MlaA
MTAIRTIFIITALALSGCASNRASNPADPFEPMNRGIYKFNDTVDKAVVKPVARGYKAVMPNVGRIMVSNFFSNLDDIDVTANDLLQFKLIQGWSDALRFVVNSTIGILGTIDLASKAGLPKHDEDFGQTLGKWGLGNGPYLVLPILGPSTLRDSAGLYVDGYASPIYRLKDMQTRNQAYLTRGVNRRAQLLDQEKILDAAMIDPYQFIRDAYLLRRKSQVYDGHPPRPNYNYDDGQGDDALPSPVPGTPSSATDNPPQNAPR